MTLDCGHAVRQHLVTLRTTGYPAAINILTEIKVPAAAEVSRLAAADLRRVPGGRLPCSGQHARLYERFDRGARDRGTGEI